MDIRFPRYVLIAAVVFAAFYRLFPIVTGQPALSQFFITEDGYLMLTIARNMAIGLGMSVSDGMIATNGIQPLATFLFAIPYFLTGGDKVTSLVGILVIMAAIGVLGFFLVRSFARTVMMPRIEVAFLPLAAATLWFVSPKLLLHSMNGLETGLQTVFVLLTLLQFARVISAEREGGASLTDRLALGTLCGLVFLSRNDAAFLVIAIFGIWFVHNLLLGKGFVATVIRLLLPGLLCLTFAVPWMAYNKINFGSIVPISGIAESLNAKFGQNAIKLAVKFFEHTFPFLPVPNALEGSTAMIVVAAISVLVVLAIFLTGVFRYATLPARLIVLAYLLYGLALTTYYGLFFGAAHFMSRYFAPLAPLLIVAALWSLTVIYRRLFPGPHVSVTAWACVAASCLSTALLIRLLLPGVNYQGHFQVVGWVEENVQDETWVGAVQTGTLGYWHDRTINLDGKVNPQALEARRQVGDVLRYVVEGPIEYIADWQGVSKWASWTKADFDKNFEVIVHDPKNNLAVLRRIVPGEN